MHGRRHQLAAEQQHAEKGRFQKERHQALIGQERRNDVAGDVGEAAPVGAELKRHDDAGDDAHAEGDGENPQPELREIQEHGAPGQRVGAFEEGNEGGQADGEGRQQDVPADDPGKLNAGQEFWIELHVRNSRCRCPNGATVTKVPDADAISLAEARNEHDTRRAIRRAIAGKRYRYVRRPSL